jgi:hypothetical protein
MVHQIVRMMSVTKQVYGGYIFGYLFSSVELPGYHTTFPHCPLYKPSILQNAGRARLSTVDRSPALPAIVSQHFSTSLSRCMLIPWFSSGQDNVSIANRYGVDNPGIDSRCRRGLPHPSRPALGPIQPPVNRYWVSFPRVNRSGREIDHPPTSNVEVKERIELHLYSQCGPSWSVLGWPLPGTSFGLGNRWQSPAANCSVGTIINVGFW